MPGARRSCLSNKPMPIVSRVYGHAIKLSQQSPSYNFPHPYACVEREKVL